MDDLISRQWLIECAIEGWIRFDTEKDENRFIHLVRDIAPSVQPEQKVGKWIIDGHHIRCSACDVYMCSTDREGDKIPTTFCPNCGAKMKE